MEPEAVCEFLAASYVPAPRTFFRGIHKLPPGAMLVYENGRATTRLYWEREVGRQTEIPFAEAAQTLTARLRETISLCLKSNVEVGAFLSGGIDSSLIVALMAEHGAKIQTFTVGYRGAARGFNELEYAQRIARHIGTQHHELLIEPGATSNCCPKCSGISTSPSANQPPYSYTFSAASPGSA